MAFVDRIGRPIEFDELMQRLGGQAGKSEKAFDSLKAVMMFAAGLAVMKELRPRPFERSAEKIALSVFSGPMDRPFIAALALAHTRDVTVLHPERMSEQVEIFEQMASAGLEWIRKELESFSGDDDVYFRQLVATVGSSQEDIIDDYFS